MCGKSPFIVLDDADLSDNVIEHAATSAFWNGSQNCSANMRQLVDARIAEKYLDRVVAEAKCYKVGNHLDPETDFGTMVAQEHMTRVTGYIENGRADGTRFSTECAQNVPGCLVESAVFGGVRPEMAIAIATKSLARYLVTCR